MVGVGDPSVLTQDVMVIVSSSAFQMPLLWFLWWAGFLSLSLAGRAMVEPCPGGQGGRSFEIEGDGIVESSRGVGH